MRLERRITAPEPKHTLRRDRAERLAAERFPDQDITLCFCDGKYLAFPFGKNRVAYAHELEDA